MTKQSLELSTLNISKVKVSNLVWCYHFYFISRRNTHLSYANSVDPGPEVIKLFPCSTQLSMKYIKKFSFSGSDKPRMIFFLFIIVKMPTTVGILTIVSRKNFMLN